MARESVKTYEDDVKYQRSQNNEPQYVPGGFKGAKKVAVAVKDDEEDEDDEDEFDDEDEL
jgi:hypothetical protein